MRNILTSQPKTPHLIKTINILLTIMASLCLASCSGRPIKPDGANVKVTRQPVDIDCRDLGTVNGRVRSTRGTFEEALQDMRADAARMGATHIQVGQTGPMGTSINGRAYSCD